MHEFTSEILIFQNWFTLLGGLINHVLKFGFWGKTIESFMNQGFMKSEFFYWVTLCSSPTILLSCQTHPLALFETRIHYRSFILKIHLSCLLCIRVIIIIIFQRLLLVLSKLCCIMFKLSMLPPQSWGLLIWGAFTPLKIISVYTVIILSF